MLTQIPSVQSFALKKTTSWLKEKIGADFSVGHFRWSGLNKLLLEDVYVEDNQADTLAAIGRLEVGFNPWALLSQELIISNAKIKDATVFIIRDSSKIFNFNHFIQAFTSSTPTADTTAAAPWEIDLSDIHLLNINFTYRDEPSPLSLFAHIGELKTSIDDFSLLNQVIVMDQLQLDNSLVDIRYAIPKKDSLAMKTPSAISFPDPGWSISAKTIDWRTTQVKYRPFGASTPPLVFDPEYIDVSLEKVAIEELVFDEKKIKANIDQLRAKAVPGIQLSEFKTILLLDQQQLSLTDFYLETPYSQIEHETHLRYQQFSDLGDFVNKVVIDADLKNLKIDPKDIRPFVGQVLPEKINQPFLLSGKWQGSRADATIQNLDLKQSQAIQLLLSGRIQGLPDINQLRFNLDVKELKTSYAGLQPLLPANSLPKGLQPWKNIQLQTKIRGRLDSIIASPIDLYTANGPELHGKIQALGLPDIEQTIFKFQLDTFITTTADWNGFVPDTLPALLTRLGTVRSSGTYEGSIYDFVTDLKFTTAIGNLTTQLTADFNKTYTDATYQGKISMTDFDLGQLLQDSLLGKFTLAADVNGSGLSPQEMNTTLDGSITRFTYENYQYDSILLDGRLKEGVFYGEASIDDQHLTFDFSGKIPLTDSLAGVDFTLQLDTVNLHRLNLYPTPLGIRANITANTDALLLDDWKGLIKVQDLAISDSLKYYRADSIVLTSYEEKNDIRILDLNADFLQAKLSGDYRISALPREIGEWMDQYFPVSQWLFPPDTAGQGIVAEKLLPPTPSTQVNLELALSDPSALTNWLLPELKELDTFHLSLDFEPSIQKWEMNAWSPLIHYGDYVMDSLLLTSLATDVALNTNLKARKLLVGQNTEVPRPQVNLNLKDQKIETQLLSSKIDQDSTIWRIGARLNSANRTLQLHLATDPIFNGQKWQINEDNEVSYQYDGDYAIQSLNFKQNGQALLISGDSEQLNGQEQITIQFQQFLLQTLAPLLDLPDNYMTGIIDGQAQLNDLQTNLNYTAQLELKDWTVDSMLLGNLNLEAKQMAGADIIQVNVGLKGEKNDLSVRGDYAISDRRFDLQGDIGFLSMRSLDPFLIGLIKDSNGGLTGQFQLKGTPDKPALQGKLKIQEASTQADFTGARYSIQSGEMTLTEKSIRLNKWDLKDELGNPADLSGQIHHNYFQDIQLDLDFNAKNFQFFNTTEKDNDLFYGKLLLDATVDIGGTAESPKFRVNATTSPNTQFFVVPLSDEQSIATEDYIIFGRPQFDSLGRDTNGVKAYTLNTVGVDLSLDLTLTDDAELQVIIDPLTGDKLVCRGNANLSVDMNEAGDVNIYGTYEVEEGKYNFSYEQLAKREFQLLKNSRITFAGDPLEARLDIRAAYQTRVPLSDLVANQLTEEEGAIRASAQRVDVRVLLMMKGGLADPELSFDIELVGNPQGSLVDAARNRLIQLRNNPSELNTQVFGLLLFNSFIKENAGQSIASAGQSAVWSSVSKLVSGKLNQLADQYLKGVSVNIGVDAYQAGATGNSELVTELELGLSKRLFNDRLKVSVGGNLNVGGETTTNQGVATNFAGDFALEYALTPSGNYQLRVYRRSDFDALNQSNVVRSGAGFSLQKSFKGKRQRKRSK